MKRLDLPLICITDMDGHQYLVYDTLENRAKIKEYAKEYDCGEDLPEGRSYNNIVVVHKYIYDLNKNPWS